MNAEFRTSVHAALNPKLLAVDLVPIENRRARAMFLCLLPGGLTVALTIGLLDVLVFHADAPGGAVAVPRRAPQKPHKPLLPEGSPSEAHRRNGTTWHTAARSL
jgi:hypothetical protein